MSQSSSETVVIGGNGYIGSALMERLEAHSIDMCMFGENLGESIVENFAESNLSEYKNIILLAGHSSVPMSEFNKQNAWVNNVDYFIKLCEKLSKDQRLIYASSGSVYGRSKKISDESQINNHPINQYDLTKSTIDLVANKFISDGKHIIGLRYGTVNGPSRNTRADIMINMMYKTFLDSGEIQYNNSEIMRPILSLEDLINAYLLLVSGNKFISGQYNMCSFNASVEDIVRSVSEYLDCESKKIPDTKPYDYQISNKKFRDIYNFEFHGSITSIIKGLCDRKDIVFSVRENDLSFGNLSCGI